MNKPVIIAADSTCDLSPELIERYHVKIIPAIVMMDEKIYYDMVNAVPDDMYAYYKTTGKLPRTTLLNAAEYADHFRPIAEQEYSMVLFNTSMGITLTHQNALRAAEDFEDFYPVDSQNLSTGIGLQVIKACEMRDKGYSAKEIAEEARKKTKSVRASFVIDTLEFLYKGGRCSGLAALGANLLKLKPCIQVTGGKMEVGKKYRGKQEMVLEQYTKDTLAGREDLDLSRIFITHSGVHEDCIARVKKSIEANANFKEILVTRAGCVISAHCGPNTLGILFMTKA